MIVGNGRFVNYNRLVAKTRLDILLVERGLAESRSQAQRLVMAGQVRLGGQMVLRPATGVAADSELQVDLGPRYVSRGGEKLEAALLAFDVPLSGRLCADVGASTGGFTDCLLQHGAARVYAIDVGHGILDWNLRKHPGVIVMEGTNARYVTRLPEPVDLVTVDASFISLKILLPVVKGWLVSQPPAVCSPSQSLLEENESQGDIIALIKPQFEAGRAEVRRGKGVIRDPLTHRQVLSELLNFAQGQGYGVQGLIRSPLLGPKGNVEFLAWLKWPGRDGIDLETLLDGLFTQEC